MNKERILALADLIERQPHADNWDDEGFNMLIYYHVCGTPSCIAGFAAEEYRKINGRAAIGAVELVAAEYMGMPHESLSSLFRPPRAITGPYALITSAQAAKCLRILADTGKVDWAAAMEEKA